MGGTALGKICLMSLSGTVNKKYENTDLPQNPFIVPPDLIQ